jgi:hypothetical protein
MSRLKTQTIFKKSDLMLHSGHDLEPIVFSESVEELDLPHDHDDISSYSEEMDVDPDTTVKEYFEPIMKHLDDTEEDVEELVEEYGDEKLGDLLPGSSLRLSETEEEKPKKETTYKEDGDLTKFMQYIIDSYPSKIPQHDGKSTLGCERAISYLDALDGEISRAIREDKDNVLDIGSLEDIRVRIMKDVIVLKEHLTKLKAKFKEEHKKKAEDQSPPSWKTASGSEIPFDQMVKEASTPKLTIAVSAFERAIVGILINAHVSAGHPLDEVFKFLCEKYDLTDREQLAVLQVCMDSGFHIFKDRGSMPPSVGDDGVHDGVDFVKNYFA